jgi:predicted TPR repeat methyltransferase
MLRCPHFPGDLIERCCTEGRILEVGVGAGFDAQRFCSMKFDYVGIDLSLAAVMIATDHLRKINICASIINIDFFDVTLEAPLDLIFDRGVYHNQPSEIERNKFVKRCAELLKDNGHWISVIGSADSRAVSSHGSLYLSNAIPAVERYFEIITADKRPYGPDDWPDNFDAWYCLFKKRAS